MAAPAPAASSVAVFLRAALVVAVLSVAVSALGCSGQTGAIDTDHVVAAGPGDKLTAGTAYCVDLDGDIHLESIMIDEATGALTIGDGDTVYHSRGKWRVAEACLGDTDGNGLVEVVTLLDADDGRRLGLFAHFGGEYRERLVTSILTPRPLSLRILPGDLLELTEEPLPGQSGPQTTIYRWNGFGFTVVDSAAP